MLKVLLIFISIAVYAQEEDLSDFSVIHKLQKRDQENIQFILKKQEGRFSDLEKRAYEVQLSDVVQSPLYRGMIIRGTQLVSLLDGKTYYTPKDIYVFAYSKEDNENYHYIRNENGTVTHKVRSMDIANISTITQMYEPPLHYKPVVKVETKELYDKEFKLDTEIKLHLGFTRPQFMTDLTKENHFGKTIRYEFIPYVKSGVPYQFGIAFDYESTSATLNSGGDNYLMRAFSLGPSFKSAPFDWAGTPLVFVSQFRTALYSDIQIKKTNESLSYDLAQTSLLLGLEKIITTKIGNLIIGLSFQRQWSKPGAKHYTLFLDNNALYDDSISLHFGHGSLWKW